MGADGGAWLDRRRQLLRWNGGWLLGARFVERQRWSTRMLIVGGVLSITLTSESLLIRDDTSLSYWVYSRLPLHLMFASVLVGGNLLLRACDDTRRGPAVTPLADQPAVVDVMTGTGYTQLRIEDIECLEADRNYINVHTRELSYLLRQTLGSIEKSLSPRDFLRIHRSMIVNRAKIRERRRGGVLVMSSGRVVRISRAFVDHVNQRVLQIGAGDGNRTHVSSLQPRSLP